MTELTFEWTVENGNRYRDRYDNLSFKQKQWIFNKILSNYLQVPDKPAYLLKCLENIEDQSLRVVELGGYDGTQALQVLEEHPRFIWFNYEISAVAQFFTKKELKVYDYNFKLLEVPFVNMPLVTLDLFYTSKMLEHFRLREIQDVLTKTRGARYQVHVIDWFWAADTHVVERNCHLEVTQHLADLGYTMLDVFHHPERSHIFAARL